MNKISLILSILIGSITLLTSCGNSDKFTLKGNLKMEEGDCFWVVYDDPISKVDSIFPIEGKFEYEFVPDTITLIRLVDKKGYSIPVFADKGWSVNCEGNFSSPQVKGNGPNDEYHNFINSISMLKDDRNATLQKVEEFIQAHPHSYASAYLINRYFIQVDNPDIKKINTIIAPLDGEVKDSRILNVAIKSIPSESEIKKENLGYFSLKDRSNTYISWNSKKNQYILINFWASWDKKSTEAGKRLYAAINELPNKNVKVFNISLDYNKEEWLKSCQPDNDNWIEICDAKGWESVIVKQNNILSLPSNILINNQRKILARDIDEKSLADVIKPAK